MSSEAADPRLRGTTALIDLIQQDPRHSRAWPDLVDRYRSYLWTALRHKRIPLDAVNDLVQEVFLKVFRALAQGGFDRSKGSFKAYLMPIIRNAISDYLRKAKRNPPAVGSTEWAEWLANLPAPIAPSDELEMPVEDFDKIKTASREFAKAASRDEVIRNRQLLAIRQVVERIKARMKNPEQFDTLVEVVINVRDPEQAAADLNIACGNAYQKLFRLRRWLREEGQALLDDTNGEPHGE